MHASYSSARAGLARATRPGVRSTPRARRRRGGRRRGSARARRRGRRSLPAGRPRISLHARDLVGAERVAVRGRGVLHLRRRVADVRTQRRPATGVGLRPSPVRSPASSTSGSSAASPSCTTCQPYACEALRDVVAVRELGVAVDRDVVVVVDEHHAAELQVAGERRGFVADALHQVAVAADAEHVVVAHLGAEARAQVLLGDRDADRVADALTERTGRDLDTLRVAVLGVTGRARAPLAELRAGRRARARSR